MKDIKEDCGQQVTLAVMKHQTALSTADIKKSLADIGCYRCRAVVLAGIMEAVRDCADELSPRARVFLSELDVVANRARTTRTYEAKALALELLRGAR